MYEQNAGIMHEGLIQSRAWSPSTRCTRVYNGLFGEADKSAYLTRNLDAIGTKQHDESYYFL